MEADLDMNGHSLLNAANVSGETTTGTSTDLTAVLARLTAAEAALTDLLTEDANLAGNISSVASDLNQINFLLGQRITTLESAISAHEKSLSFNGLLPDNTRVASIVFSQDYAVFADFTYPARNTQAPSTGDAIMTIKKDGVNVGLITWEQGNTDGLITFSSDVFFDTGTSLEVHTQLMHGMLDPYFTFKLERN